jgi:TRAP-type mannitol/chloroaromatic compound transport system permease small subunit
MLAACENLLVLLLLILFLRKISAFKIFDEKVLFFLSYSLCLAFIIGFTTPVTGGLVRYKTAFMIYLLLALLMAGNFSAGKRLRNLFISDEH